MRLILLRHAETAWTRTGQHTGRTDLELTPAGEAEARASAVPHVHELLAEFDYGRFEGLTPAEIRAQAPGWSIWADRCPDGESIEEVSARADAFLRFISERHTAASVCAVSHGHFLRVLAARLLGLAPQQGQILAIKTTSIAEFSEQDGRYVLARWNLTI